MLRGLRWHSAVAAATAEGQTVKKLIAIGTFVALNIVWGTIFREVVRAIFG